MCSGIESGGPLSNEAKKALSAAKLSKVALVDPKRSKSANKFCVDQCVWAASEAYSAPVIVLTSHSHEDLHGSADACIRSSSMHYGWNYSFLSF
ncbi:hypothetical protein C5167_029544 [Papaver somniferum]|nr:hypothetical protein C5167_029544 [Papaver somniferum]